MKKLIRKLCIVLAAVIAFSNVTAVDVLAATNSAKAGHEAIELSGLSITDLDTPVPGLPLDTSATVTTAEGVSWAIPVIWVDDTGKNATICEAGRRYIPTFVIYVPGGYKIKGAGGSLYVKLPAFLSPSGSYAGQVCSYDPATNITYITYAPGYLVPGTSAATQTNTQTSSSDSGSDPAPEPEVDPVQKKIEHFCDKTAIDTLDRDYLVWLIDVIKNVIEPQAVNLLREKFPMSLGSAEPGKELASEIGLHIYYRTGTIDGEAATPNALAYVKSDYDSKGYRIIMAVDASSFSIYDSETKKWKMSDDLIDGRNTFHNTVVHEMMHAFMDDYTRYGMWLSDDAYDDHQAFPMWFVEGIASSVENVYMFRYDLFAQLKNGNNEYTDESIKTAYTNPSLTDDNRLDLQFCRETKNTGSAYVSGYLATLYLGYLVAEKEDHPVFDGAGNVNMDNLRYGVDTILYRLHGDGTEANTWTTDSLIIYYSDPANNNNINNLERYESSADFTNRFIKGVNGAGDAASVEFVQKYLTWLDNVDSGGYDHANGTILFQDQNFHTPIDESVTTVASAYRVSETEVMAHSDVDDRLANLTGGESYMGNGTHDYAGTGDQDNREAAKSEDAVDPAADPAAIPAIPENGDVPATPDSAADAVPADPSVADPAPADAIVPEAAPVDPAPADPVPSDPAPEQQNDGSSSDEPSEEAAEE